MGRVPKRLTLVVAALAAVVAASPARAFDTAAHFDITGDALRAEGFTAFAVQTAQVDNWFQDLYVNSAQPRGKLHGAQVTHVIGAAFARAVLSSVPPEQDIERARRLSEYDGGARRRPPLVLTSRRVPSY